MQKISLIGAGNFGFALTYHLDRKQDPDLDLYLYDYKQETVDHIRQTRSHPKFYPTVELSDRVQLTHDFGELLENCDVLILAMVSTALESILQQIKPLITKSLHIVSVMKALDNDTGLPLSEIIKQQLPDLPITVSAFAGGTTGTALTQEQYLGATLACQADMSADVADSLRQVFASSYLQVQLSSDLLGVQYASSCKNLISVIIGILQGLGFGYGTQTHALSLAAGECAKLAISLGADQATFQFASQCWGNDMVMSATSPETRNPQLGKLLGQGLKFSQAVAAMKEQGKTAESVNTLAILPKIADLSQYPLLNFLVDLSQETTHAHQIVKIIENYP